MSPTVSVVIPCYNSGTTIGETLESLQKQTFDDWEAIVVNDGATDNSGEIIQKYRAKDSRIKQIDQDPFDLNGIKEKAQLTLEEIGDIVDCFVEAIIDMKKTGFDGVQLHAAHGGLLSRFLSPYTNRRDDVYGGSSSNRVRIIREIVNNARKSVGNFPILIKMNCTDYLEGGINIDIFSELAREIEHTSVDALEVSGGMWECLFRSENELGFRPIPAPESHTRIKNPKKQSYFLQYAEKLSLGVPVILVGGNRDIERLEEIVHHGKVEFIALSRPLIREPDLPKRWLEGRGGRTTECISCNSCIYAMLIHPGRSEPGLVTCVHKNDKSQHLLAQKWLSSWVRRNTLQEMNG